MNNNRSCAAHTVKAFRTALPQTEKDIQRVCGPHRFAMLLVKPYFSAASTADKSKRQVLAFSCDSCRSVVDTGTYVCGLIFSYTLY